MKRKTKLYLGIFVLLLGNTIFWIGRQNNDICRNEFKIERDINTFLQKYNNSWVWRIQESNAFGDKIGLSECHTSSLFYMMLGSLIMFFSGLMLGREIR